MRVVDWRLFILEGDAQFGGLVISFESEDKVDEHLLSRFLGLCQRSS